MLYHFEELVLRYRLLKPPNPPSLGGLNVTFQVWGA